MKERKMVYRLRSGIQKRVIVARIKRGNDLLQSINNIVLDEGIKAGVILSAVGALNRASLRNVKSFPNELPITDVNRKYKVIEKPCEILSLSGNIGEIEDNPGVHAHISLSFVQKNEVKSIGEHLVEGCVVSPFAEIVIAEISGISMEKRIDMDTKTYQLFEEAE
jgi:predicted DNA-binding protein with PD1-like motif